jgi:hypothetical protein
VELVSVEIPPSLARPPPALKSNWTTNGSSAGFIDAELPVMLELLTVTLPYTLF